MRRILSLSNQQNEELGTKMSQILGGVQPKCTCGCQYEGQPGGATTCENSEANFNRGIQSPVPGAPGCKENKLVNQQFWFDC